MTSGCSGPRGPSPPLAAGRPERTRCRLSSGAWQTPCVAMEYDGQRTVAPRVVIIGAGFGGLAAARALGGEAVQVTVCDRLNYHLFQPLLYQVALAGLSATDVAVPIRSILHD